MRTLTVTGAARRGLRLLVLLCLASVSRLAAAGQALTYTDILRQLTDLDRLTRLHEGFHAGQYSSWDRRGREVWGANGDAGHYLRIEENGEAVMMDQDGPGVITRIWSANPRGKIRLYLDGAARPTYEWDFNSLFTGEMPPFSKPLVYKRGEAMSASDCYLPIPFARHVKITADKQHGQYYHINYLLYPQGWAVPSFRLPLTAEEDAALKAAARAWTSSGRDPKPRLAGQRTIRRTFTLAPGGHTVLADLRRPGIIRAIRARVSCPQRYAWRKLVLRGTWDGARWPQILTPLGPFFGFDWETPEYGSLIAGCKEGQAYFYYPMPFHKSGRLEVCSFLSVPAEVSVEVEWAPVERLPRDTLYFFARWRREADSQTFDYPFLETAGRGHFVGVAMPIDHPLPGWWGEGDEKVWVDDDGFPPWIGTGSEDYFGDAWGIRYLPEPSFGCSQQKGHRTCNYRWHFMDFIPFSKRFRMTIENYGPNGAGPRGQYEYTSTAFWYQAERTPPFEQLRGVAFTGGTDPHGKPEKLEYGAALFGDIDADAVRTYGRGLTFARESEDLFAGAVREGRAKILDDAELPYELNRERAVDFGNVKTGDILGECELEVGERSAYFPKLFTGAHEGAAGLAMEIAGRRLNVSGRPQPGVFDLDGVVLEPGRHRAKLIAATAGRAMLDCVQMPPARRESGAIEAEEVKVVRVTGGGEAPRASEPRADASAGRVLEWRAAGPDQGIVVEVSPRPRPAYVLGVRALLGPDCGTIQAFADGRPMGPQFSLYAEKPGESMLPLGPLPEGTGEVEIRVVGKAAQSGGYRVLLDAFRFEPAILGPGTAEGVWARVLRTAGCEYRIQDLGARWSGGHHLWLQPSHKGATVEIALEIPREGDYELSVSYTTSWDYAIVQVSLDGKPLGSPVDCYTPEVRLKEALLPGRMHLTPGRHVLQFKAVEKNNDSRGYLMGIDHVAVREAK